MVRNGDERWPNWLGFFLLALLSAPESHSADSLVRIERRPDGAVYVEAKDVEIAEILTEFGKAEGISFQKGALQRLSRSVRCENHDLRMLLKCLAGEGTSFMIRYQSAPCLVTPSSWCGAQVKVWDDADKSKMPGLLAQLHRISPSIEELLKSTSSSIRTRGIDELLANSAVEGGLALSLLRNMALDPSSEVRASAVHGLAVFESPESQALILAATQDESPDVRLAGIDAVVPSEEARETLERALKDQDADVRELATMRLQTLIYNPATDHEDN